MHMSDEQLAAIDTALAQRGATLPCPRCAGTNFMLDNNYIVLLQTHDVDVPLDLEDEGRLAPMAVILCLQCGFTSLHALTVLGVPRPESSG